jgi:hypothetical protein
VYSDAGWASSVFSVVGEYHSSSKSVWYEQRAWCNWKTWNGLVCRANWVFCKALSFKELKNSWSAWSFIWIVIRYPTSTPVRPRFGGSSWSAGPLISLQKLIVLRCFCCTWTFVYLQSKIVYHPIIYCRYEYFSNGAQCGMRQRHPNTGRFTTRWLPTELRQAQQQLNLLSFAP